MAIITIQQKINNRQGLRSILSHLARRHKLFFSRLEKVSGHLLALDTHTGKLVLLKRRLQLTGCMLIDLAQVKTCSIIKEYHAIAAGALDGRKLTTYIKSIFISFRFHNNSNPFLLPVFQSGEPRYADAEYYERKAGSLHTAIEIILKRKRMMLY